MLPTYTAIPRYVAEIVMELKENNICLTFWPERNATREPP